jgi:acetyl esterase/lipase
MAAGNCEIRADIYGASSAISRPAVMWIHGGALIFGKNLTRPFSAGARQLGYVIVSIDYRLAPATKLPQIIMDVQDA